MPIKKLFLHSWVRSRSIIELNSLGGDPVFVQLLGHDPTPRSTCPVDCYKENQYIGTFTSIQYNMSSINKCSWFCVVSDSPEICIRNKICTLSLMKYRAPPTYYYISPIILFTVNLIYKKIPPDKQNLNFTSKIPFKLNINGITSIATMTSPSPEGVHL